MYVSFQICKGHFETRCITPSCAEYTRIPWSNAEYRFQILHVTLMAEEYNIKNAFGM
jgi:hypothetical protein